MLSLVLIQLIIDRKKLVMKTTKTLFAIIAITSLAAICGFAQTDKPPVSKYDAELAKRLGGNENGMKSYTFVMLRTGPNDDKYKGKEREEMFKGHFANIGRMADLGKLLIAGPFDKNDRAYRGLFIFNATADEAIKLMEGDPTIKNGIFVADVIPWYGSAAVMAIPEIHLKLIKPKQ